MIVISEPYFVFENTLIISSRNANFILRYWHKFEWHTLYDLTTGYIFLVKVLTYIHTYVM